MYWVHVELVYGKASWWLKDNLTIPETVMAAVIVIPLMLLISTLQTHREKWKAALWGRGIQYWPPIKADEGR